MPTANAKSNTRTGDRNGFFTLAKGGPELRRGEARRPRDDGSRRRAPERSKKTVLPSTRGYIKLSSAAKAFNFDFRGKTVLDIGSSTGGFTEYALEKGAKRVIAVEKGTNQMMPSLRNDPRIELHEKTDIFDFKLKNEIDTVVADVSFLSLKPILNYVSILKNADFLVMLKPQFEAKPNELINGVIKNEKTRRKIIKDFEQWLKNHNFIIIKKRDNDLKGKTGNTERFYYIKLAK